MRQLDAPGRSQVFAENGIVATSHPTASAAALTILREGGTAVDAALAAAMVLSVVEPQMTGIGGDCFAIVSDPNRGGVHALNGSGRSAAGADLQWYVDNGFRSIPLNSPHAVTVPGALKGFEALHEKFGRLDWERLFTDAIDAAEKGFAVSPRVGFDWGRNVENLSQDEGCLRHYLPNRNAPKVGDRVTLKALGETLRKISLDGVKAFYEGEVAEEIAKTIQNMGGFLTEEDLAATTAEWVDPISTKYNGYQVMEIPPSGQGMVALIMMNMMELLNVRSFGHNSVERYHNEIEIGRVAYAIRDIVLADPDHMPMPVSDLISMDFAKSQISKIIPLKRNEEIEYPILPSSDTVYLTVADRDGQMVSLIYSIYKDFGSRIATRRSGVLLQNRGACFNVIPGHPNAIGSSKRPLHTIIPALALRHGKPAFSFGVMGGAYQPMGQAHVFSNMVDYDFDPQFALDHPRIFWGNDGVLEYESGISKSVVVGLEARGHKLRPAPVPIGGGQVIKVMPSGFYCAGSDPRKDGLAIGY